MTTRKAAGRRKEVDAPTGSMHTKTMKKNVALMPPPAPRPNGADAVQIAIRLPRAWIGRADALIAVLSRGGLSASRTSVLRAAVELGLRSLEAEAE